MISKNFVDRLAYCLYESAVQAGLESRHDWSFISTEYTVFASNLIVKWFPLVRNVPDAISHDLPDHEQGDPHSYRG